MRKHKEVYRYYDPKHLHLRTLQVHERSTADLVRKTALRCAVVLVFFAVEGIMMWSFASAQIRYSAQADALPKAKPKPKTEHTKEVAPQLQQYDMYVVISKLLVNAPVEPVGVTSTGEMANPSSLQKVAWYKDGAKPGQPGSVVLAGHTGNPSEIGIFQGIDKLADGDTIEIRTKDGKSYKYQVYKTDKYAVKDVPLQDLYNKSDGSYLNLVSCVGNWDASKNSYDQRFIVYTKLVE